MPAKRPAPLLQDSQLSLFDVAPEITPAEPGAPRSRRELWLGQHRVGYELKRARRRSIGFVVGPQGLRVSAPRWVPIGEIERALHHKGEWILRKLVEQRERQQRIQASRIEWLDGGRLPYFGEVLTLVLAPAEREVVWDTATRQLRLPLPLGASALVRKREMLRNSCPLSGGHSCSTPSTSTKTARRSPAPSQNSSAMGWRPTREPWS